MEFEWRHLLAKLKRRDREKFIGIRGVPRPKPHPLFRVTSGGIEDWERNPDAARKFTGRVRT
jgi:hypothetical protein